MNTTLSRIDRIKEAVKRLQKNKAAPLWTVSPKPTSRSPRWDACEDVQVLQSKKEDLALLAKKLGRSYASVAIRRHRLKKGEV